MSIVKLLDGGFSTQLSTHVGDIIDGDPLWTAKFLVTDPTSVLSTHLDFLRAGSDIIQTNTYQATITGFVKYLNFSRHESLKLIHDAVDIAKRAVTIFTEENENVITKRTNLFSFFTFLFHDATIFNLTIVFGKCLLFLLMRRENNFEIR